jgi:hypothetical protein
MYPILCQNTLSRQLCTTPFPLAHGSFSKKKKKNYWFLPFLLCLEKSVVVSLLFNSALLILSNKYLLPSKHCMFSWVQLPDIRKCIIMEFLQPNSSEAWAKSMEAESFLIGRSQCTPHFSLKVQGRLCVIFPSHRTIVSCTCSEWLCGFITILDLSETATLLLCDPD